LRAAKAFLQEHCRRQGIFDERESALSRAPDRVPETDAVDGQESLPDHHGHAFARADVSEECSRAKRNRPLYEMTGFRRDQTGDGKS